MYIHFQSFNVKYLSIKRPHPCILSLSTNPPSPYPSFAIPLRRNKNLNISTTSSILISPSPTDFSAQVASTSLICPNSFASGSLKSFASFVMAKFVASLTSVSRQGARLILSTYYLPLSGRIAWRGLAPSLPTLPTIFLVVYRGRVRIFTSVIYHHGRYQ